MSKKTFMAVIAIAGLLLSLVGMQFVELTTANPIAAREVNPPDSTPPVMSVISPINDATYPNATITLEFSVNAPEQEPEGFKMQVNNVHYIPDWQNTDTYLLYSNPTPSPLNFSCTLSNVPYGNHSLQVIATGFFINVTSSTSYDYYILNCSSTVHFAVDNSPTSSPIPNLTETPAPTPTIPEFPITTLAITALTATILVGAIFGARKRVE